MEESKKRGSYKIKETNRIKLMSFYKKVNDGKLDKLGKNKEEK